MKEQNMIQPDYISILRKQCWSILLLLSLSVLGSCSETEYRDIHLIADKVNLQLAVTGIPADEGTDNAITDLRMIDFCSDGKTYNWLLYDHNNMSGIDLSNIQMSLPVGIHKMYFIANGESKRKLLSKEPVDIIDESDLNNILISYEESLKNTTSLSTPLLMTCVQEKTWGKDEMGTSISLPVELKHTCVKVSYELKFDNSDVLTKELKGKHFQLTSLHFKNLAKSTKLWSSSSYTTSPIEASKKNISQDDLFEQSTWTYTGTAYIPECIYKNNSTSYSYLEIVGKITDSQINSTYQIQLTGTNTDPNTLITPRGTEYRIAGKIRGLGVRDGVEAKVSIVPWTPESITVSVGEYRLDVSKTQFNITSDKQDTLYYTSNAPAINFSLDNEKCTYEATADNTPEKGMIIVKAKGNIRNSPGGDTGSANLSATLSNGEKSILTKKMTVNYDFQPFLKVTPQLLVFNWEGYTGTTWSENVTYETNLPNVSVINIFSVPTGHTVSSPQNGIVTITVPKVENTVEYTFTIQADDGIANTITKEVRVIVKPDLSNIYRIHFRVINDIKAPTGTSDLKRWGNCQIDVYNETATNVSRFCGTWPGTAMTYTNDALNRGWFVYDLNLNSSPNVGGGESKPIDNNAKIEPGISLIMFTYDNGSGDYRYQVQQRYPGHKEPGIPLFKFDDHEGWFVYDPTSAASSLQFYDDEPNILDINYKLHLCNVSWGAANIYLYREYGSKTNAISGTSGAVPHKLEPFGGWGGSTMAKQADGSFLKELPLQSLSDNLTKDFYYFFHNGGNRYPADGVKKLLFSGQNWTEGWFNYSDKHWYSTKP